MTDEFSHEWLQERSAQYYLSDDTRIEVKHDTYDNDPGRVLCRARITPPAYETLGADGLLRRVTLARYVRYQSFVEDLETGIEELDARLKQEFPPDPELEEMGQKVLKDIEAQRFETQLHPQYRPAELIEAKTITGVESRSPKIRYFHTERYSPNMPALLRASHLDAVQSARDQAGMQEESPEYTVPEHKALIAQLAGVDPELMVPEPLESDFETGAWGWIDLGMVGRYWRPRNNPGE